MPRAARRSRRRRRPRRAAKSKRTVTTLKERRSQRLANRRNRHLRLRRERKVKRYHTKNASKARNLDKKLKRRKKKSKDEEEDELDMGIPIVDEEEMVNFNWTAAIALSLRNTIEDLWISFSDKLVDVWDYIIYSFSPIVKDLGIFLLNNLGLFQEYEINDFGQRLSPRTGRPVLLSLGPFRIVQEVEDAQAMRKKWDPYILEYLQRTGKVSDSWRANRMAMEVFLHMDDNGVMRHKPDLSKLSKQYNE